MTTILIAEDNAMVGMMMQLDLEAAGYAVLGPFARSAPALEAAEAQPPALALLDIDLAGGDSGIDLAARLRERWSVPCLFVTGQGVDAASARELALGVMTKPFRSETLVAAVEDALAVAAGETEARFAPRAIEAVSWFHQTG